MLALPPVGCSTGHQSSASKPLPPSLPRPAQLVRRTAPEVPLALRDQRGQPRYATWYPPAKRTDETPAWAAPRAPVVSLASIPAKDRKLVSRVQFYAYTVDVSRLEFFSDFAGRAADTLGIPTVTRTCETDVQAVTIIRGPFVHAKSKEAIWRRTHAREIAAYNAAPSVVEAWHAYLKRTVMPGLGIRFETIGYHEVGFGQQMGRGAKGRKPKSANGSKKVDGPIASSASASASAP
jgi:small subunit ribosomal protein S10